MWKISESEQHQWCTDMHQCSAEEAGRSSRGRQAGRMQTCLYLHFGCAEHHQQLRLISWFGFLISTRSGSWQADMETSRKATLGWIQEGEKVFIFKLLSICHLICGLLWISLIYSAAHKSAVSLRAKTSRKMGTFPPTQKELRWLDEIFRSRETLIFGNKRWYETGRFQLLTPVG